MRTVADADSFVPRELQAAEPADVATLAKALHHASPPQRARLLELCLPKLGQYRASHAVTVITSLLAATADDATNSVGT